MYKIENNPYDASGATKISAAVGIGVPVLLRNLKVQVQNDAAQVWFGAVTGTMVGAGQARTVYGAGAGTWFANQNVVLNLTTTFSNPFSFTGQISGNISEFFIRDAGNNVMYRVTVSTAGSNTNNIITIEILHG